MSIIYYMNNLSNEITNLAIEAAQVLDSQGDNLWQGIPGIKPWHIKAFKILSSGSGSSHKQLAIMVGVSTQSIAASLKENGILRRMVERGEVSNLVRYTKERNMQKLAKMSDLAVDNIHGFLTSENENLRSKNSWNVIKEVNGTSQPKVENIGIRQISIQQNIQLNFKEKVELIKKRLNVINANEDISEAIVE